MKTLLTFLLMLLCLSVDAVTNPLTNAVIQGVMNGGGGSITNLSSITATTYVGVGDATGITNTLAGAAGAQLTNAVKSGVVGNVTNAVSFTNAANLFAGNGSGLFDLNAIPGTNVLAFGAKGDGVTDDTAAINAATAAVNTLVNTFYATGGGRVILPRTSMFYLISTNLIIYPGVVLEGEGEEATWIGNTGLTNDSILLAPTVAIAGRNAQVAVQNLTIFQVNGFTPTAGIGIHIASSNTTVRPMVENVNMVNLYSGLELSNTIGGVIENIRINQSITNDFVFRSSCTTGTGNSLYAAGSKTGNGFLFGNIQGWTFNSMAADACAQFGAASYANQFNNGPISCEFTVPQFEGDTNGGWNAVACYNCIWNGGYYINNFQTNLDAFTMYSGRANQILGFRGYCGTNTNNAIIHLSNGGGGTNFATPDVTITTGDFTGPWQNGYLNAFDPSRVVWSHDGGVYASFYGQIHSTNSVENGVTNYGSETILGSLLVNGTISAAALFGDYGPLDVWQTTVYTYPGALATTFINGPAPSPVYDRGSGTTTGWGEFFGTLTNVTFNTVSMPMRGFDTNNFPTNFIFEFRNVGTNDPTISPTNWPLVLAYTWTNPVSTTNWFTNNVSGSFTLPPGLWWFDTRSDGYWTPSGQGGSGNVTNGPPWPGVVNVKGYSNTDAQAWSQGGGTNPQSFFVQLGNISPVASSFVLTSQATNAVTGMISNQTAALPLMASPAYALTTFSTTTNNGPTATNQPTENTSTFSGYWEYWGNIQTTNFNALQFGFYAFDAAALPSFYDVRIRQMPSDPTTWTNNPSTFPLLFASGPVPFTTTYQQYGTNTVLLTNTASITGNVSVEILMDGHWGGYKVYPPTTNAYVSPEYVTMTFTEAAKGISGVLSQTNWSSGTNGYWFLQFGAAFGNWSGSATNFTPSPQLNAWANGQINTNLAVLQSSTNTQALALLTTNSVTYSSNNFVAGANFGTLYPGPSPLATNGLTTGWGEYLGNIATPFNSFQVIWSPITNTGPTLMQVTLRNMTNAGNNPSTWPILYTTGLTPSVTATGFQTNTVVMGTSVSGPIWFEMLGNSGFVTPAAIAKSIGTGVPYPQYIVSGFINSTNWISAGSNYAFQFGVPLGNTPPSVTGAGFNSTAISQMQGALTFTDPNALHSVSNLLELTATASTARSNIGAAALNGTAGVDFTSRTNTATTLKATGVVTSPHFDGAGTAPTIVTNAGAGSLTATATLDASASDAAMTITLTTGTLPTLGTTVFTVTFTSAYSSAPHVVFNAANANSALLSGVTMVYASSTTTNFTFTAGSTALAAATAYKWMANVIQ